MDSSSNGHDAMWDDPVFQTNSHFEESMMGGDSPYMTSIFDSYTNPEYVESPAHALRTPAKATREPFTAHGAHQQHPPHVGMPVGASTESSSQDSASDTSSRRKRKVTESPISDQATEIGNVKQEETLMDISEVPSTQHFDHMPTRPMHNLSLEPDNAMSANFDFNSAASSPAHQQGFRPAVTMNQRAHIPTTTLPQQYQRSPIQTINPGMMYQPGRDDSPGASAMFFNSASPNALFSTPSSDSNETFTATQLGCLAQNPTWPANYSNQFASPPYNNMTPSPIVNGATPARTARGSVGPLGQSPLHIAPISTKSRVETQINIVMTLEKPPPGIEHVHLPLHTIAKSKLLAKDDIDQTKALELHSMLVCTSAMNNPQLQEKAMQRAAAQDNVRIQERAEKLRELPDEEKNDFKNVPEDDKAANGGEVRICNNCIQRERKRAGRKKLKKEEEQQHWERFETERVVVFNSNEYLPLKPFEPPPPREPRTGDAEDDLPYMPPDGAMQVTAAMRIACYCRHQSEKEGFRVIFTLKDQQGNVVAQQMSDSILITDDHKTHPPSFAANVGDPIYLHNPAAFQPNGLPFSQSMVDLANQQVHPFTSSRSTGNLQALAYGQQPFAPQSHIHQMQQMSQSGYTSQATSATMTPANLSRPASPSGSAQMGPNKKRKSSTFNTNHRRVPSGLTMTPRVDTSQPPSSNLSSALSVTSPFSPNNDGFGSAQGSYMTIPQHNGPAQFFGSGPPTPSEHQHQQQMFTEAQIQQHLARSQNAQAYFSHPSSAVPSRANSPVMQQTRPNMAAYARQQPIQTPTNSIQQRSQQMYQQQAAPGSAGGEQESIPPTIVKITPTEGPVSGGTEVSIYGYNFPPGTQVMFGDTLATTTFYGPQALLAVSPPSRPGGVNVTLIPPAGQPQSNQYFSPGTSRQVFTYTDRDPRTMELALRLISQQQNGNPMAWNQVAAQMASKWVQNNVAQAGLQDQGGYGGRNGGGNMMAADAAGPSSFESQNQRPNALSWTGAPGREYAARNLGLRPDPRNSFAASPIAREFPLDHRHLNELKKCSIYAAAADAITDQKRPPSLEQADVKTSSRSGASVQADRTVRPNFAGPAAAPPMALDGVPTYNYFMDHAFHDAIHMRDTSDGVPCF